MMRRSFLTFLFAVLLVFGQQQAMVHAYVHTADWQKASSELYSSSQSSLNADKPSGDSSTSHSEVCGKCVVLANLCAAVGTQAHVLDIVSSQFHQSAILPQSIVSSRLLAYHSRAPPRLV